MTVVGRDSAQWVVQPALNFNEVTEGEGGEYVPESRVVEPAIGNDTILE